MDMSEEETYARNVTILILIDGFLQLQFSRYLQKEIGSHNPYFNRWFSAMELYGNKNRKTKSHNPYFNRWFSAIKLEFWELYQNKESQSLF